MLFNSLKFLIFFPSVVLAYFLIPSRKVRCYLLLIASYYFYMCWNPKYIFLILTSTIITFISGLWIGNTDKIHKKRLYVAISFILNLGILFLFKYYNFFNDSLALLFKQFNMSIGMPNFEFLLPVGISFYTLQALSYTVDVYRGDTPPEKDFIIYALYVTFFPQLVAGPIERSFSLMHQFNFKYDFDYKRITSGLKLMAWGYFKKVVIADKTAIFVDAIYKDVYSHTGLTLIIATVLFAFQIYCDFAGYTDIAIGSAEVMGIKLMKNFERPYYSKSVAELWRRWHMSLMNWFRDYMYISMGGNRVSRFRYYFNVFSTFTMSGLWHGASWTFIIWGSFNGLLIIMSTLTENMRDAITRFIRLDRFPTVQKFWRVFVTFSLFCFGAIFFRSQTLPDALYVVQNLFNGLGTQLVHIASYRLDVGMNWGKMTVMVLSIIIMETMHMIQRSGSVREKIMKKPIYVRFALYYCLVMWILLFGEFESKSFYYFQF